MNDERKSNLGVAAWSWEQTITLAKRADPVIVGAIVAIIILRCLGNVLAQSSALVALVAVVIEHLVETGMLTLVAVAMHRFCILGEERPVYDADMRRRLLRFFWLAIIWTTAFALPSLSSMIAAEAGLGLASLLVWLAILVPLVGLCLMTLLAFPAIAVDVPGSAWRFAIARSKGRVGQILVAMIKTAVPLIVLSIVLVVVFVMLGPTRSAGRLLLAVAFAPVHVLATAAFAAAASRLYMDQPLSGRAIASAPA